jgi:hypothetical protein
MSRPISEINENALIFSQWLDKEIKHVLDAYSKSWSFYLLETSDIVRSAI